MLSFHCLMVIRVRLKARAAQGLNGAGAYREARAKDPFNVLDATWPLATRFLQSQDL